MGQKIVGKFENNDTFVCYKPLSVGGMDFVFYECGYEKCDPKHFWGPGKKDYYVLHYCLSGKGHITINKKDYELTKNQGFFLSPQDVAYYVADENDPWEYIWVYFGGTMVKGILSRTFVNSSQPIFDDTDGRICELFQKMHKESLKGGEYNLAVVGYCYLLFSCFEKTLDVREKKGEEESFQQALTVIQNEFERNINIDHLAKKVGYSRSSLYRIFIKNTGMGPKEYVMRSRVTYACEMIKEGKKSLSEIAFIVGFNDYKAFVKVFSRIIGVHPGEFIERLKAGNFIYDKNMELIRLIK